MTKEEGQSNYQTCNRTVRLSISRWSSRRVPCRHAARPIDVENIFGIVLELRSPNFRKICLVCPIMHSKTQVSRGIQLVSCSSIPVGPAGVAVARERGHGSRGSRRRDDSRVCRLCDSSTVAKWKKWSEALYISVRFAAVPFVVE